MIYIARKVHSAYTFFECFEVCQVSELGASEKSLVRFTLRYIYCAQRTLLNALDLSAIR